PTSGRAISITPGSYNGTSGPTGSAGPATDPYAVIASPNDPNGASADVPIQYAWDYSTVGVGQFPNSTTYIQFGGKAQTTMTVSSSTNPSVYATNVTFTATVYGAGGTPTGSVGFLDGGSFIAVAPLSPGTAFGTAVATYTTSSLTVGSHSITASYGGD